MKLHHYNEAYAHMVRRARFADGTPKPLPKPERSFADKLKTLKSVSQGISPESRIRLLDYFIQEALTKGQLTEEQASGIYNQLREDKDKIREQIDDYERDNFVDGGRIGFYKGELVTDGPNKGKYKVKFASKSTSPGYPDEFIGTQYYDSETLANKAIEDRKVFSKKNVEIRDQKNVEMGKAKKADYKKIIDSFIDKGDYENFKTQLYESQMVDLPSGKQRRTTGGRVPQHILKFIRDRLNAGPGTELFEELKEITGRTDAELLEFRSKIPEKGYIPVKDRSQTARETSGVRKTDEEKLETQQKAKKKRAEAELVGKKYASEAELERFKVVNNQKKKLNKFFQENHKTIFNTDFGKKVRELMDVRIDGEGNFFKKDRPDSYYVAKAKEGKIFDIFDINKISKGQVNTKYTSNLNILPGQFNQAFIEGQVNKYFKKGGRLEGNTAKLNNVSNYLDSIGVKVDIEDVGRIGGGEKVFFDSKTNSYPHITNTLKKMNIPNDLITDVNPTKGLKDMFPNVAKYGGKLLTGASKVVKPLSVVMGPYAVLSAQDKAKAAGIDLNLSDQAMAFYMGDPDAAISMSKMRTDPEYAAEQRAKTLARPLDEGTYDAIDNKSTFGKYNDQIKNIKLP